ncbi:hypothetical protein BH11PLA2_BH11PLA2_34620 [soil metagenome]
MQLAEGRQKENWNHTSHLIAYLLNANRGPNSPEYRPHQFNPFHQGEHAADPVQEEKARKIIPGNSISILKVFLPKN